MSTLSVSAIQNPAAGQSNILLNADGSVTLPVITGAAAPLQFQAGTLWFDTAGPALQIRNPANTAWVALSSAQAATLAEAAAGTLNTVYSSPLTSVPKDAAGMTGAAILPNGVTGVRPAGTLGMTRVTTGPGLPYDNANSDALLEYNDGTNWIQTVPLPTLPAPGSQINAFLSYDEATSAFAWNSATDYVQVGVSPSDSVGDVQLGLPVSPNPGTIITTTPSITGVSFGLFCCHGYQYLGASAALFQDGLSVYDVTLGAYIYSDWIQLEGNYDGNGILQCPFSVQTTLDLDPTHTYYAVMWGAKNNPTGTATGAGGTVRFIAFN